MVQQHQNFIEMTTQQQDQMMSQRASQWISNCTAVWHCARIGSSVTELLPEDNLGVWFVIADTQPYQTVGLLLAAYQERWEVLPDKTLHVLERTSQEVRQRFLETILAELQHSSDSPIPVWRSDQEEI